MVKQVKTSLIDQAIALREGAIAADEACQFWVQGEDGASVVTGFLDFDEDPCLLCIRQENPEAPKIFLTPAMAAELAKSLLRITR